MRLERASVAGAEEGSLSEQRQAAGEGSQAPPLIGEVQVQAEATVEERLRQIVAVDGSPVAPSVHGPAVGRRRSAVAAVSSQFPVHEQDPQPPVQALRRSARVAARSARTERASSVPCEGRGVGRGARGSGSAGKGKGRRGAGRL